MRLLSPRLRRWCDWRITIAADDFTTSLLEAHPVDMNRQLYRFIPLTKDRNRPDGPKFFSRIWGCEGHFSIRRVTFCNTRSMTSNGVFNPNFEDIIWSKSVRVMGSTSLIEGLDRGESVCAYEAFAEFLKEGEKGQFQINS